MKLTPWFPASVKPARVGWYQAAYYGYGTYWRYWTGARWRVGVGIDSIKDPIPYVLGTAQCEFGFVKKDKWRGLAKPPKEKK
jgi:hypothetical protein